MTDKNRVSIELIDNEGNSVTSWTRFEWRDNYLDPLKTLSIQARPNKAQRPEARRLLTKGRLVALKLNGVRQATMLITTADRVYPNTGPEYSIEAKTVLVTPFEGSADPYLARNFNERTQVADAVLAALEMYGFDQIRIAAAENLSAMTGKAITNQQANVITTELKKKDIQVGDGEKAYAFAARIYARFGLVLIVDVNGGLLLAKPDFQQDPSYTICHSNVAGIPNSDLFINNPPPMVRETNDGQYSEIVLVGKEADKVGQKSATAPTAGIIVDGAPRPEGSPFPKVQLETIPAGRHTYKSEGGAAFKPLYKFDKRASDRQRALIMATTMHGARSQNGFQITGAVEGMLSSTGAIWTSGTTARVVIPEEDIDEPFWILENTKSADLRGQRTRLTLIPKGSLILGEA